MLSSTITAFFFLLLLICACTSTAQKVNVTQLEEDFLRDDVGLLDTEQRQEIISLLTGHNKKALGRIYLDIIQKLPEGKTIQQYAYDRLNEQGRMANDKADRILVAFALE